MHNNLLLPKYSYYEILTAMAEYFIQDTEASEIIINHFKTKLIYTQTKNMLL